MIPPHLRSWAQGVSDDASTQVAAAFTRFNEAVIDCVAGACAAVKPQAACYEAYGWRGWQALASTVDYARRKGVPVVVDAKRGDIGSTAAHYREALVDGSDSFDPNTRTPGLGADWLTVNPYLGEDSLLPFLGRVGAHGLFVVVKTSNAGGKDVQDVITTEGETVAIVVARLVDRLAGGRVGTSGWSDVGAVVGATWPREARALREVMPHSMFLVPGYGVQGGDARSAVAGARSDGEGILVSSSRAITGAWTAAGADAEFADAIRDALDAMNRDLEAARSTV